MDIRITALGVHSAPITVEVFGLSLSLAGITQDVPLVISETSEGIKVYLDSTDAKEEAILHEDVKIPDELEGEQAKPKEFVSLFDKLSDLRKKIAADTGLPPYVIFHDNTLRQMEAQLPKELKELRSITGVGNAKLEKYGEIFLTAIKEYIEKEKEILPCKEKNDLQ